jgi:hypothetical protein
VPIVVRGRPSRSLILSLVVMAVIGLAAIAVPSTAAATGPQIVGSSLKAGAKLLPGQSLQGGAWRLDMQPDGNLVLQNWCMPGDPGCPYPAWALGTSGQPGNYLVMQTDGNLVLYSRTGRTVWDTQTRGTGSSNVFVVRPDSNLVVYSGRRAVWSTGLERSYVHVAGRRVTDLRSNNGRYVFAAPGNSMATWNFGSAGSAWTWGVTCHKDPRVNCEAPTGRLMLLTDGNLVWFQPGARGGYVAEWATNTGGRGPTNYLVMQDDGNLVLYDMWHRALWNSLGLPLARVH